MAQNEEVATIVMEGKHIESLAINKSIDTDHTEGFNIQTLMRRYFRIKNQLAREFLAECFGTFILCAFGLASVAQFKFFADKSFLSVNVSFGFGATLAGIVVGKVSGCHVNPAVSFAFLITGRMKKLRFIIYVLGQFIGAFLGAFIVWIVYYDAIKKKGIDLNTAGIFSTFPSKEVSAFSSFFDQVIATSLLIVVVLAVSDKNNNEIPHGTTTIIVGLTVTIIGTSFGYNCGYAINPARDLAPRLFTAIAGWADIPFTAGDYFFWLVLFSFLWRDSISFVTNQLLSRAMIYIKEFLASNPNEE